MCPCHSLRTVCHSSYLPLKSRHGGGRDVPAWGRKYPLPVTRRGSRSLQPVPWTGTRFRPLVHEATEDERTPGHSRPRHTGNPSQPLFVRPVRVWGTSPAAPPRPHLPGRRSPQRWYGQPLVERGRVDPRSEIPTLRPDTTSTSSHLCTPCDVHTYQRTPSSVPDADLRASCTFPYGVRIGSVTSTVEKKGEQEPEVSRVYTPDVGPSTEGNGSLRDRNRHGPRTITCPTQANRANTHSKATAVIEQKKDLIVRRNRCHSNQIETTLILLTENLLTYTNQFSFINRRWCLSLRILWTPGCSRTCLRDRRSDTLPRRWSGGTRGREGSSVGSGVEAPRRDRKCPGRPIPGSRGEGPLL